LRRRSDDFGHQVERLRYDCLTIAAPGSAGSSGNARARLAEDRIEHVERDPGNQANDEAHERWTAARGRSMTSRGLVAAIAPRELPVVAEGISLWWCALDVGAEALSTLATTLAAAEHARAARFGRDSLRARWIAGRASLRWALGRTLRIAPAAVPIVRGARGRPELVDDDTGLDFNVSHTGDVALIGIRHGGRRTLRIGVDVERADRDVPADRLARRVLTPAEQTAQAALGHDERRRQFLRYWTCKEAMSKATGDGLSAPFRRIDVIVTPHLQLRDGPEPYRPPAWQLLEAPVPAGYVATVALWERAAGG
jgi:4'-phosphopantetheinyl transferase